MTFVAVFADIGSHVVKNLVEHGYTVRACVRDKTRADKTAHLQAMAGAGTVEIVEADMLAAGSYDGPFAGCIAVFHVAEREHVSPERCMDDGWVGGSLQSPNPLIGCSFTQSQQTHQVM